MTTDIIKLKDDATTSSLKLNEENLWFSSDKINSIEKMQAKVEKNDGKFLNYHGIIDYSAITRIKMNEKSDQIELTYPNKKGKEKSLDLAFDNVAEAHKIGDFIAGKTNLAKSTSTENKNMKLLKNLFWVLVSAGITAFIAFGQDMEVDQESYSRSARRSRSFKAIVNLLHEYIGQTGIIIIGSIITLFFLYSAWKRFSNPVNDIVYQ